MSRLGRLANTRVTFVVEQTVSVGAWMMMIGMRAEAVVANTGDPIEMTMTPITNHTVVVDPARSVANLWVKWPSALWASAVPAPLPPADKATAVAVVEAQAPAAAVARATTRAVIVVAAVVAVGTEKMTIPRARSNRPLRQH
jgi:hypothetical protein